MRIKQGKQTNEKKVMTKTQYMIILKDILNRYTQDAIAKINHIKQILPEKARSVEVGIHPTQDEEGIFSIMIHLIGPDLYVLNKVIEPYRELFGIKFIDAKLQPEVPLFDPYQTPFSVNDLIVEVSIDWLKRIWNLSGGLGIPAYAFGEECSKFEGLIPLGE